MDRHAQIAGRVFGVMEIIFREMRAKLPGGSDAQNALDDAWAMSRAPHYYPRPLWQHARSIVERCASHVYDNAFGEAVYWAQRPGYPDRHLLKHARWRFEHGLERHNLLGYPHESPCPMCLRPKKGRFHPLSGVPHVEPANDWEKSVDPEYLAAGRAGLLPTGIQAHFDWKQKMEVEQAEYERQLAIDRANGYLTVDEMVELFDKAECCQCRERQFLEDLTECSRCKRPACFRRCGEWTTELEARWLCNGCVPAAVIESAHRFS